MTTVHAGTDTYGRVKTVCGTPIVTKFFMIQFVPCYPLRSFYLVRSGRTKWVGIPLVAGVYSADFQGIPLASVDKVSVIMAYVRCLFATLLLAGFIWTLFAIVSYCTGMRGDEFTRIATIVMAISLVAGAVGGGLTYLLPLTPHRERAIRNYCFELFGISADPARVQPEISVMLANYQDGLDESPRTQWIRQLIATRAKIGQGMDPVALELKTDELLAHLEHADRVTA